MSRLKVLLRGAQISELQLNTEREYIGGRKESCDIRLQAEKGISREHFRLKFEDGRWVLTSLSRFGEIYSLGQRVESVPLEHGQTFQIPPYEFAFSDVADASVIVDSPGAEVMPVDENERTVIGAVQQVPYIKMMSSSGEVREMLRLEVGDVWTAGRDPSCQIIIPDQRVSRRQFEVRKINGIYTIIDLSSVNGTFLNGSPISSTDPQPLKSGDSISVLDNTMYFELHDPNFQYRMERIEVPPMQINQSDLNFSDLNQDNANDEYVEEQYTDEEYADDQAGNGQYLQEIEQPGYDQQYDPAGGPFTGMPNDADPNQYYAFTQQAPPPPTQEAAQANAWQRFTQNKPVFISVILLILVGSYFLSESLNAPQPEKPQVAALSSDDPLAKLTPEERANIELWYNSAEKALRQQSFSIAKENLENIHKILPTGYKESKTYEIEAVSGEQTIIAQQENERREKEQAEQQAVLKDTLEKCAKLLDTEITVAQMEECLSPATIIDPANAERERLIATVAKRLEDRRLLEEEERQKEAKIAELKVIFENAEKVHELGFPKKTIKAYQVVVNSALPDPEGLKEIAQRRIKLIEKKIDKRNDSNMAAAEIYLKEGNLKQGIISLRGALDFDPDNQAIKDKIEKYSNELRNQVRVIYQESVIDENYGNVDGSESRPGAKEKWKKIIEMDVEDGEYYRKAYIKLRKYGVL